MRKPRILLVDDEPALVRLISLMLAKLNRYEIFSELDGTLALEKVVQLRPDLVLLDWLMPKITGKEVADKISADPRVSDTPILFLSALVKAGGPKELSGFPALAKPIGIDALVEAIEKQLETARSRSAPIMSA